MERGEGAPDVEPLPKFPIPPPAPLSPYHDKRFRSDVKEKRQERWQEDPDRLLQTQYSQFCNVIMMATFTGGIQIAILAFMNDLISPGESPSNEVLKPAWTGKWQHQYTVESFGMMIGFLAVGLSMGCAGVAAVNAALTCYYSVYPPTEPPAMEGHVLLCMLLLFGSFALSGLSSTLLSTKFDIPFTIAVTFMLSGAVALAGYQIVLQILAKRISPFKKPWHLTAVVVAAITLSLDLLQPTSSSWYTMLVCGCTAGSYVVAILFVKGNKKDPLYMSPWVHASGATGMVLMWVGCTIVKLTWGLWDDVAGNMPYVLAGLSSLEVILFGVITIFYWCGIGGRRKYPKQDLEKQGSDLYPLMAMPVPDHQFERSLPLSRRLDNGVLTGGSGQENLPST